MGSGAFLCVDLLLAPMESTNRLVPASAMGMLWLQTHFDNEHWDELSRGLVALSPSCSESLIADALEAGLKVNRIPSFAQAALPQIEQRQQQS